MLILAIIVIGIAAGWVAQLVLGRNGRQTDWTLAFVTGIVGSFVGGLLFSLIAGDGLAIEMSGLIGSIIGAIVVLAIVRAIADSVAVMHRGRLVRFGPKSKVLSPPFDDYTDLLLKSVPEMEIGWLERVLKTRRMESAGN